MGGTRLTFTGQTHDNRAAGQVEVCLDADCRWASVQLEGEQDGRWSRTIVNLAGQDNVAHTVSISAVDLVGNQSQELAGRTARSKTVTLQSPDSLARILDSAESSSLNFRLDNVAPAITVTTAIAELEALPDRPPTTILSGTVTDGSGVRSMYAMVRDPAGNLQSQQVGRGDGDAWWYDLPPGGVGQYAIWINAVDEGDNATTFGPHYVYVTCRSADLTAVLVNTQTTIGAGSPISLTARVRNNGSDTIPIGLPVAFYAGDTLIGTASTTRALYVGASEDLTVTWDVESPGDHQITVSINDDGAGAAAMARASRRPIPSGPSPSWTYP